MFRPQANHCADRNIPYIALIIKLTDPYSKSATVNHQTDRSSSANHRADRHASVYSGKSLPVDAQFIAASSFSSVLSSIRKAASHQCSVHCGKQLLINPERHLSKIQCIRIRKRALIDCIKRFHIFCIFLHDVQILTHEGHSIV